MDSFNIDIDYDLESFLSRKPPTPTPQYLPEAMVVSEPPTKKRRDSKRQSTDEPLAEPSAQPSTKPSAQPSTKPSGKSSSKPSTKPSSTKKVKQSTSDPGAPSASDPSAPEYDDEEEAFRELTGIGRRLNKTFELDPTTADAPMSQYYTTGADPNAILNQEFDKFRRRVKKNLFRMQPVSSLRPEVEPLLKDLFDIIFSYIQGKKTKRLDRLLTDIGYPGITEEDLGQKKHLGEILVKLIEFNETGTYSVPILLPIFVDNLFKRDSLKFPAISMTYFLLNDSLPIENSAAVLRLIAKLAAIPQEFIDAVDKGFRFTEKVLDNIKKLV
ncbi:unnamed protein product [Ceutorhynchus assimilis]|uniref:Uncharacterized protein n=1 Tax=Ceutorhynchus assimilis TaxID=467358 RepID=A0A9N9MZY1_9CUCU|nr:unnamed protein product [Ceutorhynchus assimilis]